MNISIMRHHKLLRESCLQVQRAWDTRSLGIRKQEQKRIIRVVLEIRVPLRFLFIRVPYKIWDPKRDPTLENYP